MCELLTCSQVKSFNSFFFKSYRYCQKLQIYIFFQRHAKQNVGQVFISPFPLKMLRICALNEPQRDGESGSAAVQVANFSVFFYRLYADPDPLWLKAHQNPDPVPCCQRIHISVVDPNTAGSASFCRIRIVIQGLPIRSRIHIPFNQM